MVTVTAIEERFEVPTEPSFCTPVEEKVLVAAVTVAVPIVLWTLLVYAKHDE